MTDSRFQLNDRIDNLEGELKRAEEQDRLNAQELADRDHAQRLAQEAKAKSEANIARIKQALREAGQAYSEAVLALTGDGPIAMEVSGLSEYQRAYFAKHGEIPVNLPQLGNETCDECGAPGGIHRGDCETAMRSAVEAPQPLPGNVTRDWYAENGVERQFPNAIFNGLDTEQAQ